MHLYYFIILHHICYTNYIVSLYSGLPELIHRTLVILHEILTHPHPCDGLVKNLFDAGLVVATTAVFRLHAADNPLGQLAKDVLALMSQHMREQRDNSSNTTNNSNVIMQ